MDCIIKLVVLLDVVAIIVLNMRNNKHNIDQSKKNKQHTLTLGESNQIVKTNYVDFF